jgi:hypothetical protein
MKPPPAKNSVFSDATPMPFNDAKFGKLPVDAGLNRQMSVLVPKLAVMGLWQAESPCPRGLAAGSAEAPAAHRLNIIG